MYMHYNHCHRVTAHLQLNILLLLLLLLFREFTVIVPVLKVTAVTIPFQPCDGGVMVSIVAFQAVDPGSIPGHRTFFFLVCYCQTRD